MKKLISFSIILCLFLFSQKLIAQNSETDSTSSHLQIEKGITLFDEGKYDEALAIFNNVSKCDPNYWWACYETALVYYNQDKLEASLAKIRESEDLDPQNVETIALIGSILDDMGRTSEAIVYLNDALKIRPYNRLLLYNLAACYLNSKEYGKAEEIAIRNIRVNPYHKSSHLLLAKVNFYMGRVAQSYLAYNMAILMNPQVSYITEFENAITGKLDSLCHPYNYPYPEGVDHRNWDECTWFLKSEMAFNKDFEYDYKINYLTTRQSLMLLSKLNYSSSDTSIYSQFYARLFSELLKQNYFETFLFYSYKNTNNEIVKDWFEKNSAKNDDFVKWVQTTIDTWKCYGFSIQNEINNVKTFHFGDNSKLRSIGNLKTIPEESKYGEWIILNNDGGIEQKGPYVNNQLEGNWLLYWPNGKIKQKLAFHNNELDGIVYTYYPNEAKSGIFPFVNGERQGLHEEFTSSGSRLSISNYLDNKLNGKNIYYYYGDGFMREADYVADKTEGKITKRWLNGVLKSEASVMDSLLEGPYRTWYSNSKPESEGNYKAGVEVGKWANYYAIGSKKSEGEYDDESKLTGIEKFYSHNGKIQSVDSSYTSGTLNGIMLYYYANGDIKSKLLYKENKMVAVELFDSNGKSLYSANENNGILKYRTYYPNGIIEMEGNLREGQRDGKWIIYYPLGNIAQELLYSNGLQTGLQKKYHENGAFKEVYSCDSNLIIGDYKVYYSSGKLKTFGKFNKDGQQGEWTSYFSNDSVQSKYFYTDDVQTGRQIFYSPSGKIEREEFFNEDGESIRLKLYDLSGNITMDQKYEYDSVLFELRWLSGKLNTKKLIINKKPQGIVEGYFPNGGKKSETPFLYGSLNGVSKTWDYRGNLILEIPYTMGSTNGELKKWQNGKISYSYTNEYGHLQGYFNEYYTNGKIAGKTMYEDDQIHGNSDFYAPDSSFMYRFIYFENSLISYTYKKPNGEFVPEKPITLETTEVICYYPNGTISVRMAMKNGLPHGESKAYYPNGKIMREKMYVTGDFEGPYKSYFENGRLKELIMYHYDERDGKYELYYENGQKRETGQNLAGQAQGEWKEYNETGKLVNTLYYENEEIIDIN